MVIDAALEFLFSKTTETKTKYNGMDIININLGAYLII